MPGEPHSTDLELVPTPIRLKNEQVVAEVLPDRGMTITRLARADGGANTLWERAGHVAPPCSRELGPSGEASIETLHDLLVGGWFEMSPHAGLPGTLDGRPTWLHGEAMRLPWTVDEVVDDFVAASVRTVATELELSRRIRLEGETLRVESTIRNTGSVPVSTTHGEHPCFSRTFFAGGTVRLSPASCVAPPPFDPPNATLATGEFTWPHAPARGGGTVDVSQIPASATAAQDHVAIELAGPEVEIHSPAGTRLTLQVDLERHPFLLYWRSFRAPGGASNGLWDVFALEPMSAPGATIDDAAAAGTVRILAPGEEASYSLSASLR